MIFISGFGYMHETSKDVHYLCVDFTDEYVRLLPYHRRWQQSYEIINVSLDRIDDKWSRI